MSWFPDLRTSTEESQISKTALLAAGKSLALCNHFESSCELALQFFKSSSYLKLEKDDSFDVFIAALKKRSLMKKINDLERFPEITKDHISILEKAKEARNYIAHEGALFLTSSEWQTIASLKRLRKEVALLSHGNNLVCLWSHVISERNPTPNNMFDEYPHLVDQWIFGHIKDELETFAHHPQVVLAEKRLEKFFNKPSRPK